jgi:dihydroorotate dehydrogenase
MRARLARDFARFAAGLPRDWPAHVREAYGIDLGARYLGEPVAHPIGKGSGQLSLNPGQLERDAEAGLAFAVLKTVIAEDETGERSMAAWAVPESRMAVERRRAPDGRDGWTVTWHGRGWDRSFAEYLALVRVGRDVTRAGGMPVVPSVKYHLPRAGEAFRDAEYVHTTRALADAWGPPPLLLEQDFSPTLAGDALAAERELVLRWVREVPQRIRAAVETGTGEREGGKGEAVRVALKLMNARFDDAFQLEMLAAASRSGADALVVFNRLFDRERGVAFGGWELSDRNLRVLDLYGSAVRDAPSGLTPPLVGTGNVCSGKMVLEYARRGCESVQVHTFFQLPLDQYPATAGSRTQRALHALVFHPADGLVAGLLDLADRGEIERRDGAVHFIDLADAHRPR